MAISHDAGRPALIRRASMSASELDAHSARLAELLSPHLSQDVAELRKTVAGAPHAAVADARSKWTEYRNLWFKNELGVPLKPLDFTLNPGSRFIAPPYDVDWRVGGGMDFFAKADGKPITVSIDGFSANGVGIVVDSTEALLAAVAPIGSHKYSWLSVGPNHSSRSRGGIGALVYEANNPNPIVMRQAQVWSFMGSDKTLDGGSGEGPLGAVVASMTSFGAIWEFPLLFDMKPGVRYLFWVWLWQTYAGDPKDTFLAIHQANIPLIEFSAGPPMALH